MKNRPARKFDHQLLRTVSLVGLFLLALFPQIARADLCQEPRIVEETAKVTRGKPLCVGAMVKFQDESGIHDIEVARVYRDVPRNTDFIRQPYDAFVLLPDSELVNLGPYADNTPSYGAMSYAHQKLGYGPIDGNRSEGRACTKGAYCAVYLVRSKETLCWKYELKSPFRGAFLDCRNGSEIAGDIGWIGTPPDVDVGRAISLVCDRLTKELLVTHCDYSTSIEHKLTGDNQLYYVVRANNVNYRVDAIGGKITVLTE
jgi:hypothetical protein